MPLSRIIWNSGLPAASAEVGLVSLPSSTPPDFSLLAEDGVTLLVAEDGANPLVQE